MKKLVLMMIPLIFVLTSCGKVSTPERKTVVGMDTAVTMTAYGKNAVDTLEAAEAEIERLDTLLSRSDTDGEIYPLNIFGGGNVSDETAKLIKSSLDMCRDTNGTFDITIAPVMDAWGFFGHEYRVPSAYELNEQLAKVDYNNVSVNGKNVMLQNGAMLDLGGVAKGYALDLITELFIENKVNSGLISFGSAISAIGTKPDGDKWTIGIINPQDKESYIARLKLKNTSISTSGSYEQVFEKNGIQYHHIINPATGYPTDNNLTSVSVICNDATKADALSTALFVMGYDSAVDYWREKQDFDMVIVTEDNTVFYTRNIDIDIDKKCNKALIK